MPFPVLTTKKSYNNIVSKNHMVVRRKRVIIFTERHICWSPARRPTPAEWLHGAVSVLLGEGAAVEHHRRWCSREKSPSGFAFPESPGDTRLRGTAAAARTRLGWPLQRARRSIRGTSLGDQYQRSRQQKKRKGRKHKTSIKSPRANTGVLFSTGKGGPPPAPFPPSGGGPEGPALPAGVGGGSRCPPPAPAPRPRPHSPAVSAAAGVPATPFR